MTFEQKLDIFPTVIAQFSESELLKWEQNASALLEKYPMPIALIKAVENAIAIFCVKHKIVKSKEEKDKLTRELAYNAVWISIFSELKRTGQMKMVDGEYRSFHLIDPPEGKKMNLNKAQLEAASYIF